MVERKSPPVDRRAGPREVLRRLPLAPTLTLSLVGLTALLALIAAVGIGNLYSARQDYEDALARTYELETASSRLLAAGVIEETAFRQEGGGAVSARARARRVFDAQAAQALSLAETDPESTELVRARVAAEQRTRRLAARLPRGRRSASAERRLAEQIFVARNASETLTARQRRRRAQARERAREDTHSAVLTAAIAGGLGLLGALALISALIGSIRRPLDQLVSATQKLAGGDLSERVEPSGPQELRELDFAFNTMAERLEGAQTRIEAEREKLAVTIESLGDALVVCDDADLITAVNPRAQEIVPGLAVGTPAHGPGSPLPPEPQALRDETVVEVGERTLSITAARLGEGDTEAKGTVWTIRDISERARVDRMKSDFVATASHELRSPLTSIKGFVELLGRSQALGTREREFVDVILQSTDRLVDLVNDLLDVARLEAGKMEVHPRLFDLSTLVREVGVLMGPRISEKDQRLQLDLPPGLPRALADPSRVRQILTNLVSNAHLYTEPGGRVSVTVDHTAPWLEMAVSDNGRGMTGEDLERVFDRFVRRDDGGTGTGLGLSIVKSLVDLQGGSIDVRSGVGEGTTFVVRLPAEGESGGDGAEPRRAIRGKRVLVVDDEEVVARAIAAQLEPHEVRAEISTSGAEALERLRSGGFDAITLDLKMDGMSGVEVLRELRRDPHLRHTPVVVVSLLADDEALSGEWRVGKPVDADALADALGSAMLAGRTRVLVVGRSSVRPELEPALTRLGLEYEWATSGPAAAQACQRQRFEVALVDAGMRQPELVLRALDLRGRRRAQAMLLFHTGDAAGIAALGAEAVPIAGAAEAVLDALGEGSTASAAAAESE